MLYEEELAKTVGDLSPQETLFLKGTDGYIYRVKIKKDKHPDNPGLTIGTIVSWNKDVPGDIQPKATPEEWLRIFAKKHASVIGDLSMKERFRALEKNGYVFLPLFLSKGRTLSVHTFCDADPANPEAIGWIYGQLFVPSALKEFKKALVEETKKYGNYLRGKVRMVIIEKRTGARSYELESIRGNLYEDKEIVLFIGTTLGELSPITIKEVRGA